MTTAQFLTLIGILSHIEATQAGFHGWAATVTFILIGIVNLLMYLVFKAMFPDKP